MRFKSLKVYEFVTQNEFKLLHEFADVEFSFNANHGLAVSREILIAFGKGATIQAYESEAISVSHEIRIGGIIKESRHGYWELSQ